jgi:hypothetical protein
MLEINIPGFKDQCLSHLVLDYNGTLACDGRPLAGVRERLAGSIRPGAGFPPVFPAKIQGIVELGSLKFLGGKPGLGR